MENVSGAFSFFGNFKNEMNMGHQSQEALEDFRNGRIDGWDAKRIIERDYGSCSCMRGSIDRVLRDVDSGFRDGYDGRRDLDYAHNRCRREDEDQ